MLPLASSPHFLSIFMHLAATQPTCTTPNKQAALQNNFQKDAYKHKKGILAQFEWIRSLTVCASNFSRQWILYHSVRPIPDGEALTKKWHFLNFWSIYTHLWDSNFTTSPGNHGLQTPLPYLYSLQILARPLTYNTLCGPCIELYPNLVHIRQGSHGRHIRTIRQIPFIA